jgi:hypothetical protein
MMVVVAVVLIDLAGDGADACACGSAYDGSLEAAAEDGSECGPACSADECTGAGAYASAVVIIVVVVVVTVVVVLAAVGSSTHASIEVVVVMLRACGKVDCEQQRKEK